MDSFYDQQNTYNYRPFAMPPNFLYNSVTALYGNERPVYLDPYHYPRSNFYTHISYLPSARHRPEQSFSSGSSPMCNNYYRHSCSVEASQLGRSHSARKAQKTQNAQKDDSAYLYHARHNAGVNHENDQLRGRNQSSVNTQQRKPPPSRRHSDSLPHRPKKLATAASIQKAIEDGYRAEISENYSLEHWDPTMRPILLLGSVFDANSLGKWIYAWTVHRHDRETPLSERAGELWLMLIKIAGYMERATKVMPMTRTDSHHRTLQKYLESGDRLWTRFKRLLEVCEADMWKAEQKKSGKENPVSMSEVSGVAFIESIFGRDRQLQETEKLMAGTHLWLMEFETKCVKILNPYELLFDELELEDATS